MDLGTKTLLEWLESQQRDNADAFPGGENYFHRYSAIADYLNKEVHNQVTPGAMLKDGGYLTDHGPDHIATVAKRMGALVASENCELTPYEVYLLLVAAHFHDVGNIYGREGHEDKSQEVMQRLGVLLGDETVERRTIWTIAQAHGGENKDKVSALQEVEAIRGEKIRVRLLAAILKFADELADDKTRAARFLLKTSSLPKESEIYHKYAESLHSVMIEPSMKAVSLHFAFTKDDALKKFGKGNGGNEVYLLDEIFERTEKTHLERMYCARFMRPHIEIERVDVKIEIHTSNYFEVLETIGYRLEEKGYPSSLGVMTICENELSRWNDGKGSTPGEVLAKELG